MEIIVMIIIAYYTAAAMCLIVYLWFEMSKPASIPFIAPVENLVTASLLRRSMFYMKPQNMNESDLEQPLLQINGRIIGKYEVV